jgi:hypothetical protein
LLARWANLVSTIQTSLPCLITAVNLRGRQARRPRRAFARLYAIIRECKMKQTAISIATPVRLAQASRRPLRLRRRCMAPRRRGNLTSRAVVPPRPTRPAILHRRLVRPLIPPARRERSMRANSHRIRTTRQASRSTTRLVRISRKLRPCCSEFGVRVRTGAASRQQLQ